MRPEQLVHAASALLVLAGLALLPGLASLRVDADLLQLYAAFAERPPGPERTVVLAMPGPLDEVDRTVLAARLADVPGVQDVHVPLALADRVPAEQRARLVRILEGSTSAVPVTVSVRAGDRAVLDALETAFPDVPLAGAPILDRAHAQAAQVAQLQLLGVLVPGLSLLVLGVLRSVRHALVVALAVGIGAGGLAGGMGWLGLSLGGPNLLLLPLVLVLGVADSVHLYAHADGRTPVEALAAVAVPCALTSLTTGLAFLTLIASPIGAVRTFGVLAAAGMAIALLTGLLLPTSALLLLGGTVRPVGRGAARWIGRLPAGLLLVGLLALVGLAATGRTDLRVGGELPVGDPVLADLRAVDAALDGAYPAVLEVQVEDGVFTPAGARAVLDVHDALASSPAVGTVHSWADVLEEAFGSRHRARSMLVGPLAGLQHGRVEREARPVLEAAGLPLWTADGSAWRVHVRFHEAGAREWGRTLDRVRTAGEVRLRGHVALAVDAWRAVLPEMLRVLGASVLAVMLVVGVWTRSWRGALGGGVVLTGAAASTLAVLVLLGQPVNHANIFVVALAVGIGADGWIHVASPDVDVDEVAPALVSTTVALGGGFLLLGTSILPTLQAIGVALAASIATTLLLTLGLRGRFVGS
jgi:hypothetical protein